MFSNPNCASQFYRLYDDLRFTPGNLGHTHSGILFYTIMRRFELHNTLHRAPGPVSGRYLRQCYHGDYGGHQIWRFLRSPGISGLRFGHCYRGIANTMTEDSSATINFFLERRCPPAGHPRRIFSGTTLRAIPISLERLLLVKPEGWILSGT